MLETGAALAEILNITKMYNGFPALKGVSFSVCAGQVLGLLGKNGAGKSTTMNIVSGYLSASSGSVRIMGHDILEEPEAAKRHIGYLPEIPPLYPDMTPSEFLGFAAALRGVEAKRRALEVERTMGLTQIDHVQNKLIQNLSKGYRQRVGIAMALLGDPELIILDEPTVGLDPMQIIEIRALIRSLGQGHGVIFSSHILSEVSELCDHVVILSDGQAVADGTPEELSRKLKKTTCVQLLIQGDPEEALQAFTQIDGFISAKVTSREGGLTGIEVEGEENAELRIGIFHTLARLDLPILEMTAKTMSFENVFAEVLKMSDQ